MVPLTVISPGKLTDWLSGADVGLECCLGLLHSGPAPLPPPALKQARLWFPLTDVHVGQTPAADAGSTCAGHTLRSPLRPRPTARPRVLRPSFGAQRSWHWTHTLNVCHMWHFPD